MINFCNFIFFFSLDLDFFILLNKLQKKNIFHIWNVN